MQSSIEARGGMPPQFRLDLSVKPNNAREFDLWRSSMSPLFAMDAPDVATRSCFGAQLTSYQFADVALVSGHSSAATFQRTAQHIARSGIDHIGLLVYTKGGCALGLEGRVAEVHPGDVCFLDLSRPISIKAPEYESLTLMLPRMALQEHIADLDGLHGQILKKARPLNAMLAGHLRTLFEAAPSLNSTDGRAAANGTAALIAAFAGPSASGRDTIAHSKSMTSLNTVRQFIEANLDSWTWGRISFANSLGYRDRNFIGCLSRWAV